MKSLLSDAAFFGVTLTILTYLFGLWVKKRLKKPIFNPMLISVALVILVLLALDIDYESYAKSCAGISLFVTPATVCFAIPLYRQLRLLRRNWRAILGGILSGVLTSAVTVLLTAKLFSMTLPQYATLLPKSITNAIAVSISEELGGFVTLTVVAVIITGIFGSMIAETMFRLLGIREPVAVGTAMGVSCHIMGTARAMEIGEAQGAMSSLSLVVAGLMTVVAAPIFAGLLA